MTKLERLRVRAIKVFLEKADHSIPMLLDYDIDDACRAILNLPDRPKGQEPYEGWLSEPLLSNSPFKQQIKLSEPGLNLIKSFEGLRLISYQCSAGVWTIGYGHTKTAKRGACITHEQAEKLFLEDVAEFEEAVRMLVKVPLNQNQFDALVSFAFNVGAGAFKNSQLLVSLNQGHYSVAAKQLMRWVHAGKVKIPGLVRRREREYNLFMGKK